MSMNDDLLCRQLLGRFSDNRLIVSSVIAHLEQMKLNEEELTKLINRQMITQLADAIIENKKLYDREIGGYEPTFVGRPIRIQTYCFNRENVMKLIQAAFNAGLEAKGDEDERMAQKTNR